MNWLHLNARNAAWHQKYAGVTPSAIRRRHGGIPFHPALFGGARLQIDRSDYYTLNFATLYLRYMFDAHTEPVPYPPDPVKPYSWF